MIINYTIEELQPDSNWLEIGTTIEPQFDFEVGKTYKIITNYTGQLGSVKSDSFTIASAPILAQSSVQNYSAKTIATEALTPISTPVSLFFTFSSDELIDDEFVNEGKFLTVASKALTPTSTLPSLFFTFSGLQNIDDEFVNEGKFLTIASKSLTPASTPPTIFFTT